MAHTLAAFARVRLASPLPASVAPSTLAAWWRGAVAARFADDVAFHGHDGERTVARYPEVHYRVVDGAPALLCLGDAAVRAMTHPWPGAVLRLGPETREVVEVSWRSVALVRGLSRRLVRYRFHAPWIALNQANHARYRTADRDAQRAMLDRILVGNLLTMSQAFDWIYGPDETVYAAFEPLREVSCTVKDVSLLGFEGTFVTNLELPDELALGRSVSHGFGWFRRLAPDEG